MENGNEKSSSAAKTAAVTLDDTLAFARRYGLRVLMRGAVSFAAVVALIVLYMAFAPRSESYVNTVQVMLETSGGKAHYPNGRVFSHQDLVAASVLHRVWQKFGLEKKVDFDKFCSWFSVVGYDKDRAKLDAEYKTKMAKRNITVSELAALQREYETKLDALSINQFVLSMKPTAALDRTTAVELLNDVPEEWYREYSVLEAPQMPAVMRPEAVRSYWKTITSEQGRALELVDALRRFLGELKGTCAYIRREVLKGRNAVLDGEDLGVHEAHLLIYDNEILRLKNRLLVNGSANDLSGYVESRKDDMACDALEIEQAIKATADTLAVLNEKSVSGRDAAKATVDGTMPQMQADSNFFSDFALMVRRDAKQDTIKKYADELTNQKKELAGLNARKLYYEQITTYMKAAAARQPAKPDPRVQAEAEKLVTSVLETGAQILGFRDKSLRLYRSSGDFYAISAPASFAKSYVISLPRMALGLLALWVLGNLAGLVLLWNRRE